MIEPDHDWVEDILCPICVALTIALILRLLGQLIWGL